MYEVFLAEIRGKDDRVHAVDHVKRVRSSGSLTLMIAVSELTINRGYFVSQTPVPGAVRLISRPSVSSYR